MEHPTSDLQQRTERSFSAQGLMRTLDAKLVHIGHGEVHIQGEVLGEKGTGRETIALMQATMIHIPVS